MAASFALSPADLLRRSRLRQAKTVATSLLVFAAVVWLAVRNAEQQGYVWAGYVSAAAEAAMIGGLADWFAVTALFRHPLGLPIPHTALIPTRKDALGESLSNFVGDNFLSAEVVRQRLNDADVARRLGEWLATPAHAATVTAEAANALRGAIEVLRDDDVRAVVEDAARRQLHDVEVAPVLGRLLAGVVADGSHHAMVDVIAARTTEWLRGNRELVVKVVQEQAPGWAPRFVDKALAKRIHTELLRICSEITADQQHPLRLALDRYLAGLAADLEHDPATAQQLHALMDRLLDHPATKDAVGQLIATARRVVVELIDEPDGMLRTRARTALQGVGVRLTADEALRGKVDTWVASAVQYAVSTYRDEITRTISDTVDRWDGAEASRRIELAAGRDLQFIRVNGSVVGALAGVVLYAVSQLLG